MPSERYVEPMVSSAVGWQTLQLTLEIASRRLETKLFLDRHADQPQPQPKSEHIAPHHQRQKLPHFGTLDGDVEAEFEGRTALDSSDKLASVAPIIPVCTSEGISAGALCVNEAEAVKTKDALMKPCAASAHETCVSHVAPEAKETLKGEHSGNISLEMNASADEHAEGLNRANESWNSASGMMSCVQSTYSEPSLGWCDPADAAANRGDSDGIGAIKHDMCCTKQVECTQQDMKQLRSCTRDVRAIATTSDSSAIAAEQASSVPVLGADAGNALGQLLDIWKIRRHSAQPLCEVERQTLTRIFFDTMPAEIVRLDKLERVEQPGTLNVFCEEEQRSLAKEQAKKKKHKEFMLLHGAGWDTMQSICADGLDPDRGHASRGSWLSQNALACHTYAAKGPGPEQEDGRRLFAMFVIACLPNHNDGDEERSFGVWRMMSQNRMCPAYSLIYSAPLDVRAQRSPKRRCRDSPDLPSSAKGLTVSGSASLKFTFKSHNFHSQPNWLRIGRQPASESADSSSAATSSSSQHNCEKAGPGRFRSTGSPTRCTSGKNRSVQRNGEAHGYPKKIGPSKGSSPCRARLGESPSSTPQSRTRGPSSSTWKVQSDNGWRSFCPGLKFSDQAGTMQTLEYKHFAYRVKFHDNGITGTQTNLSTGKTRRLRRISGCEKSQLNYTSDPCSSETHAPKLPSQINSDSNCGTSLPEERQTSIAKS